MPTKKKPVILAIQPFPLGWDPLGWRHPRATTEGFATASVPVEVARIAERGKFDYVFLDNSPGHDPDVHYGIARWDGFVQAAYCAALAQNVGFVVSVNSSVEHPYAVARQLASLDNFTGGRIGVNIVSGIDGRSHAVDNFGYHPIPTDASKYQRAAEFTEVLYKLLDSWDADAILGDKTTGVYLRPNSTHSIDFVGEHFSVKGPLNVPRPFQTRIPNIHVGTSEFSLSYGAQHSEIRFSPYSDIESAREQYRQQKERVASFGRDPSNFKVIVGTNFYVGGTNQEARRVFREVQAFAQTEGLPAKISEALGIDLKRVRETEKVASVIERERLLELDVVSIVPDSPFRGPRIAGADSGWIQQFLLGTFEFEDLTFKDLYEFLRWRFQFPIVVGDGKRIADYLEDNVEAEAFDGVHLYPGFHRGLADTFVDHVVPELQRRGRLRTDYEDRRFEARIGVRP
jgi:FMN-dependent oxidoreductase (nitrilotriacetate monooxygenase family)